MEEENVFSSHKHHPKMCICFNKYK